MEAQDKIKELFGPYALEAETEIRRLLDEQPDFLMYKMLKYFFGFLDENLKPIQNYGGKRYRPGLCLMIAEMYGKKSEALEVAASIELYHNFTLIHDDIEDNDPLRRGRPTVWRLWGINHGINSGDALLILASKELNEISKKYPEFSVNAVSFLNEKFKEVIEGQFLDFTLTDLPLGDAFVNEKNYLMMIEKKTSVLVGASARVASIIAQAGEKEQEALWQYGLNLGLAFQMQDDLISIWAD
ncbi:MAG: polyprenyl synthetase family protein, partial [Candidatus Buchananbacteria bacterium]